MGPTVLATPALPFRPAHSITSDIRYSLRFDAACWLWADLFVKKKRTRSRGRGGPHLSIRVYIRGHARLSASGLGAPLIAPRREATSRTMGTTKAQPCAAERGPRRRALALRLPSS